MRQRIIGILVSMLLIGATGIAVADWEPGDGHKMHFPQLPDPNGWDVDFHDWWLGDDWKCSETGPITDIHFWYSWARDEVQDIPWISISIYSDDPGPPSKPYEELWSRQFLEGEFIIAGPWTGDQGWYHNPDQWWENDHQQYYQINIVDISNPFEQEEGVIYWLVIQMPYYSYPYPAIGWKTSEDHWNDNAVVGAPGGDWYPLWDPLTSGVPMDFAFVITGGEPPCDPGIDVEKFVQNPDTGKWVDADTEDEALDVPISHDVTFKIVITNNGVCPLVDIDVSDTMHDSLKFISANPEPHEFSYEPPFYYINWNFPGPLNPGETIEIFITANVKGPDCSYDYNHVKVYALCGCGEPGCTCPPVIDEDYAYIHAYKKAREINRPFLQFLQSHPNLFPILRTFLGV
jgi:hypothetical protein